MALLRLWHPDSIFVQCRGIGIWHSPGCLLMGCTIGGKLASQLPLPARPRTLWFLQLSLAGFFRAFPCWVFSSYSLLMCRGCPWDEEVTPLRPRQPDSIFLQCRGLGTGSPPPPPPRGCLLTGCTNEGKLAGQLSPLCHPGLYGFYSFPC